MNSLLKTAYEHGVRAALADFEKAAGLQSLIDDAAKASRRGLPSRVLPSDPLVLKTTTGSLPWLSKDLGKSGGGISGYGLPTDILLAAGIIGAPLAEAYNPWIWDEDD